MAGEESIELVRRALEESRAREESYRERLARSAALSENLRQQTAALRDLLAHVPTPTRVHHMLREVALLSGRALDVARTSIWLFDDARTELVCQLQLVGGVAQEAATPARLRVETCPAYVRAITSGTTVAVSDAATDPLLHGLEAFLAAAKVGALLDIAIAGRGGVSGVVCLEHVGGSRVWHPEEIDFAANVAASVALAIEAGRRILAERAAEAMDAKYKHLVETLPATIYSFDVKSGAIDYLSPQVRMLGGWAPSDWAASAAAESPSERNGKLAAVWLARIHPEDRPLVEERFAAGLGRPLSPEIVYRVLCPDDKTRWIRDRCEVVRDALGEPVAVQGVLCDVTQTMEAELSSRENADRFRTLLENVELSTVLLDPNGKVGFVNDAFVRTTGYVREEIVGADWFAVAIPEARRASARELFVLAAKEGRLSTRHEGTLLTKWGERRVAWSTTLLRGTTGNVLGSASMGVDVTEQRLAERRALEDEKSESLGRLAAGVAHDFSNMLAILASGLDILDPRSTTAEMRAALKQASALTKALLTYARREPLASEDVDVDRVIDDTLPILLKLVAEPRADVDVKEREGGGTTLVLDTSLGAGGAHAHLAPTYLRQVVINLVTNAADATRGVGSAVRVATARRLLARDELEALGLRADAAAAPFVVLTVSDDGPGIDPAVIDRVFEPFFTTKRAGKGTGIGLASCRRIVRKAGGEIAIESRPGGGTTVRAYFPESGALPRSGVESEAAPRSRQTVLVIDDYPAIRRSLERLLGESGFDVVSAGTLAEAFDVLDSRPVDLLLTDEALPDGSGSAFASRARARFGRIRTVLVSGSVVGTDGFDAVVMKPFVPSELVATVQRVSAKS